VRKAKNVIVAAAVCALMIVSIYHSKDVIGAANEAITLCLQIIIPSIFPFLFLSMVLCNYWKDIRIPFMSFICKMTGIPERAQSILLLAVIGGYPVGAQSVTLAWRDGQLSKKQSRRLLGFCNNAGPSFIFGLIGSAFDRPLIGFMLWLIHISSALLVGCILPDKDRSEAIPQSCRRENLTHFLWRSIYVTSVICGWVILFRVLLVMITQWIGTMDITAQTILFGFFELTNGCVLLSKIPLESLRFIVATGLVAAGGLCVTMQTKAVVGTLGLGMYFPGKLMHTSLSILLAALLAPLLFRENMMFLPIALSSLVFILTYIAIKQKNSSILSFFAV